MGNVKGWDDETAPNFYWGSGALRLYDNHYTFSVQGNSVGLNTVYWFAINTNIAFPQPPGEEPVKPSEPTEPEAPSVTVNKYAIISALPVEPATPEIPEVPTTPEVPVTPEVPATPAPQLPNTGTADSLLSVATAFLLSGFGVLGFKKKED